MGLMKKLPPCSVLVLVLCSSIIRGESNLFKVTGFAAPALVHENVPSDDTSPSQSSNLFQVTDFGAVADGKTDNSQAFLKTWAKACATKGGGVLVPKGTFLVGKTQFEGPCSGETLFQLIGNLVATPDPSLGEEYWISFYNVDGLKLSGKATLDGQGKFAWPKNECKVKSECNLPPASISIAKSKNCEVSDITSLNSKAFHMHIHDVDTLVVHNVQLSAPEDSPNTDGIHIAKSNGVRIIDSKISTGDDCISIGDGNTVINITGVNCGPGHGISIGSLGEQNNEQDVKAITIHDCTFTKTVNGFRIKTWAPSVKSIDVSDITLSKITMDAVENPIIIDQHYCPNSQCKGSGESGIAIKDVKLIGVTGTSATDVAVNLNCSKLQPCGVELSGLDLKMPGGQPTKATCSNSAEKFDGGAQVPASCSSSTYD